MQRIARCSFDGGDEGEQIRHVLGGQIPREPLGHDRDRGIAHGGDVLAQHRVFLAASPPERQAGRSRGNDDAGDHAASGGLDDVIGEAGFNLAIGIEGVSEILSPLLTPPKSLGQIRSRLDQAITRLIQLSGRQEAADPVERIEQLKVVLQEQRSRTFWLEGFRREALATCQPMDEQIDALENFIELVAGIDEETIRLHAVFEAALAVPAIAQAREPIDCPLCETKRALTPARVSAIGEVLRDNEEFQSALRAATAAVRQIIAHADLIQTTALKSVPAALLIDPAQRRERAFTLSKMHDLIGAEASPLIVAWVSALRNLLRSRRLLLRAAATAKETMEPLGRDIHDLTDVASVKASLERLRTAHTTCCSALEQYDQAAEPLVAALRARIDERSETAGWEDLLALAERPEDLCVALRESFARAKVSRDLDEAIQQIDEGKLFCRP